MISLKCVLGFGGRSLICYISRSIRLFSQSLSFCSGHLQSDHLWIILVINTYFSDFISCSLSDAASCSLTMGQRSTVLMTRTGCPFIGLWSKVTQTVSGSSLTKEPTWVVLQRWVEGLYRANVIKMKPGGCFPLHRKGHKLKMALTIEIISLFKRVLM